MPLRMAAKIPRSETRYYREKLQPIIDGEQIKLIGEVNDSGKGELLRGAAALLELADEFPQTPNNRRPQRNSLKGTSKNGPNGRGVGVSDLTT